MPDVAWLAMEELVMRRANPALSYFARCYITAMVIAEIRLNNLRHLMRAHGHTQADVAREMGTAPAYLSQMINRHKGRRMGSAFARARLDGLRPFGRSPNA